MGIFSFFQKKKSSVPVRNPDAGRYNLPNMPQPGVLALVFTEVAQRSEPTRGFPIQRPFQMNGAPSFALNIDAILSQHGYGYEPIEIQGATKQVPTDFAQ